MIDILTAVTESLQAIATIAALGDKNMKLQPSGQSRNPATEQVVAGDSGRGELLRLLDQA
jgi:hypothetical protein